MKITEVKAVYPRYQHVVLSWRTHFWQIVVRVETDTGTVGLVLQRIWVERKATNRFKPEGSIGNPS